MYPTSPCITYKILLTHSHSHAPIIIPISWDLLERFVPFQPMSWHGSFHPSPRKQHEQKATGFADGTSPSLVIVQTPLEPNQTESRLYPRNDETYMFSYQNMWLDGWPWVFSAAGTGRRRQRQQVVCQNDDADDATLCISHNTPRGSFTEPWRIPWIFK